MADATLARLSRPSVQTDSFWVIPPLLVLAVLFFYPLSLIATQAFTNGTGPVSLTQFGAVLGSAVFRSALLHTIEISISASAGCLLLGFVIALVLSFAPFPGARVVARLIDTFIALPTFLIALAFTFIYGSAGVLNGALMGALHFETPPIDFLYSPWGVILAEVTVYTPFVLRPLLATFSLIDIAQIEVASSLGAKPWRVVREIILPAAIPALLAGGSLCLLLTVNEFGIVLFIGAKGVITLPLLVYDKAIQEFDYTAACVIALINVFLSLALYFVYRLLVGRLGGRRAGLV
ncbi:MAG: 2-aminoethylphosphonate ABC transporter permease subunit [Methylobacteriaceae bacterium]|nr:2-aminoethylphosphonate ABC transporter permease subunit [Methylobacteriaceae bacterium]MBV9244399.1 2-aminoethylphosphonate ABC transporter permease subunit [Methylobacteriaceae bacterium]